MESANNKKRLPRWAVLTLIWIGPMLALGLFWRLAFHLYLTAISWLFLVLIPGLCVTRLIFLFRGYHRRVIVRKGWVVFLKTVLYIVLILVSLFLGAFMPCRTYTATRRNAQAAFEKAAKWDERGFSPLELGSPKTTVFHDYIYSALFWDEGSYILQCSYRAEDYEAAKVALEARYTFRTEPIRLTWKKYEDPADGVEPVIRLKDDSFRFLAPEDGEDGYFVHTGVMVVTNDAKREICYVILRDPDTDIVSDLNEYLYRSCGWIFIRHGYIKYLPEVLIW